MQQMNFIDILQVFVPVLMACIGWGVKMILAEIRSLRADQKDYVRREVCKSHRESLQHEMLELRALYKNKE